MDTNKTIKTSAALATASFLMAVSAWGAQGIQNTQDTDASMDSQASQPLGELPAQMSDVGRMAHVRELLGSTSKLFKQLHAKAADYQKVENFVTEHTKERLSALNHGRWASQAGPVAQTILEESRRYEFDPLFLLAVIENESSFNPAARGSHGEIGLMQLLPETAKWVTTKCAMNWRGKASLQDMRQNIRIGAAYLDYLRKKFQWNGTLYLAAYNMGSTNVARHMSQNTIPKVYPQRVMKHYLKLYASIER